MYPCFLPLGHQTKNKMEFKEKVIEELIEELKKPKSLSEVLGTLEMFKFFILMTIEKNDKIKRQKN